MRTPVFSLCLALLTAGFASSEARAGDQFRVLVCYPGGGAVKARQAKPAMDKMLSVLASLGGWSKESFQHDFTTKVDACRKLMAEKKPAFAILSLGLFLEHRVAHALTPLARPKMTGQTDEIYRVLVKKGTAADLSGLKGKSLGGSLLDETTFLQKVVFEGKLDPMAHFELKPSKRALRALRKLHQGKLDAVLVNQQQFRALSGLDFAADLSAAFTSKPLPLIGLTADQKQTTAEDRKRLTEALGKMCSHADGKETCKMFGIEAFSPADPKSYQAVIGLWNAK